MRYIRLSFSDLNTILDKIKREYKNRFSITTFPDEMPLVKTIFRLVSGLNLRLLYGRRGSLRARPYEAGRRRVRVRRATRPRPPERRRVAETPPELRVAAAAAVPDYLLEALAEVLGQKGVDDRVDAAVERGDQVEGVVGYDPGLVRDVIVEAGHHAVGQQRTPTQNKERHHDGQHRHHSL